MTPTQMVYLAAGALALAACLLAVLAGGLIAAAAMLLGMTAGVRIRQGLEPTAGLPLFRQFLEKHVQGREAALGTALKAGEGADKATDGEKKNSVRPQARL